MRMLCCKEAAVLLLLWLWNLLRVLGCLSSTSVATRGRRRGVSYAVLAALLQMVFGFSSCLLASLLFSSGFFFFFSCSFFSFFSSSLSLFCTCSRCWVSFMFGFPFLSFFVSSSGQYFRHFMFFIGHFTVSVVMSFCLL